MVTLVDRKLLRHLGSLKAQVPTSALVVASGITSSKVRTPSMVPAMRLCVASIVTPAETSFEMLYAVSPAVGRLESRTRLEPAFTTELGLRADYAIARQHTVFIDASVTRLPDEIRQSPIVGRKDTSRLAVGYLYRF